MQRGEIVVIENDPVSLKVITESLEQAGYTVHAMTTAGDGLAKAKSSPPSLILLNLAAPGSNGLEICKTIHGEESLKGVPIVLLTLREGKFDPIYTKLYGIVNFIKKPFSSDELVGGVNEHALVRESPPAAEEVKEVAAAVPPAVETPVVEAVPEETPAASSSVEAQSDEDMYVISMDEAETSLDEAKEALGSSLDEVAPEQQEAAPGESPVESYSIDDQAEEEAAAGPTEFSMDSFTEPDADEEAGGGPAEFSVDDFAESLKLVKDEDEPAEEEGEESLDESVLSPLGGESEDTIKMMETEVEEKQAAPPPEEKSSAPSLKAPEPAGDAAASSPFFSETAESPSPEEEVSFDEGEPEPLPEIKSGEKIKVKKLRKKKAGKGGFLGKAVLALFLILVLGGGGFAAYNFYLYEKLGLPRLDVEVPEFILQAPKNITDKLSEIPDKLAGIPAFVQGLIDRVLPGNAEKPGQGPSGKPAETAGKEKAPAAVPAPAPALPVAPAPSPAKTPTPSVVEKEKATPTAPSTAKVSPPAASKPSAGATARAVYYVQFGAFKSKTNAGNLVKSLEGKGLYAFVKKGDDGLNMVLLREEFSSRARAMKKAAAIKKTARVNTAVYRD